MFTVNSGHSSERICGVSRDYWLAVGNSYAQFQHSKLEVCILLLASTIIATRRHRKVIPRSGVSDPSLIMP